MSKIEDLVERVERLLLRHAEMQRTQALMADRIESVVQERDALRGRLNAARARIDALLARLPDDGTPDAGADPRRAAAS